MDDVRRLDEKLDKVVASQGSIHRDIGVIIERLANVIKSTDDTVATVSELSDQLEAVRNTQNTCPARLRELNQGRRINYGNYIINIVSLVVALGSLIVAIAVYNTKGDQDGETSHSRDANRVRIDASKSNRRGT